jgi:ATP-dependent exoDNAse (exonuclease V) alpha subunit
MQKLMLWTPKLLRFKGESITYNPDIVGDFPENFFLLKRLQLKIGAQVMFVKNDLSFEKNYFNGKMGIIKSRDEITVHFRRR